jgi:exopolysaccharide biosynthesis protein
MLSSGQTASRWALALHKINISSWRYGMKSDRSRLKIGDKARTIDKDINVRSGPKTGENKITKFDLNVEMTIIDGPAYDEKNNIYWWSIESDEEKVKAFLKKDNNEAWIAECSGDQYYLEPVTPGITQPPVIPQPVIPQPVPPATDDKTTEPATGVTRIEGERYGRRFYLTICKPANVTIKVVHEYSRPSVIAKNVKNAKKAVAKFGFNGDDWHKTSNPPKVKGAGFSDGKRYQLSTSGEPSLIITQGGNVSIGIAKNKEEWIVTSGLRYLVKGGKNLVPPKGRELKYTERHARSVRGLDKDGRVMFLTVDGEFPSKGMTFWEAAELMLEFGCVTAFDGGGGGDSVDVVDGEVVNVPDNKNLDGSLGAERTVPQTILVFTR